VPRDGIYDKDFNYINAGKQVHGLKIIIVKDNFSLEHLKTLHPEEKPVFETFKSTKLVPNMPLEKKEEPLEGLVSVESRDLVEPVKKPKVADESEAADAEPIRVRDNEIRLKDRQIREIQGELEINITNYYLQSIIEHTMNEFIAGSCESQGHGKCDELYSAYTISHKKLFELNEMIQRKKDDGLRLIDEIQLLKPSGVKEARIRKFLGSFMPGLTERTNIIKLGSWFETFQTEVLAAFSSVKGFFSSGNVLPVLTKIINKTILEIRNLIDENQSSMNWDEIDFYDAGETDERIRTDRIDYIKELRDGNKSYIARINKKLEATYAQKDPKAFKRKLKEFAEYFKSVRTYWEQYRLCKDEHAVLVASSKTGFGLPENKCASVKSPAGSIPEFSGGTRKTLKKSGFKKIQKTHKSGGGFIDLY